MEDADVVMRKLLVQNADRQKKAQSAPGGKKVQKVARGSKDPAHHEYIEMSSAEMIHDHGGRTARREDVAKVGDVSSGDESDGLSSVNTRLVDHRLLKPMSISKNYPHARSTPNSTSNMLIDSKSKK